MNRGIHDEKFLRISFEIQGIWSFLISGREIIERCAEPSKGRCDVTGRNSLWVRLLMHQSVMGRTLSGGEPGILLKGSEIC